MMSKDIQKFLWFLLLFSDICLFIFAIYTSNFPSIFVVIIVATIIHFKGNEVMFGEFDRKRKAKYEERKKEIFKIRKQRAQEGK